MDCGSFTARKLSNPILRPAVLFLAIKKHDVRDVLLKLKRHKSLFQALLNKETGIDVQNFLLRMKAGIYLTTKKLWVIKS